MQNPIQGGRKRKRSNRANFDALPDLGNGGWGGVGCEQVTEARRRLAGYLENPHGHRDALMLDVTMDAWFKLSVEKTDFGKLSGDDLLEVHHALARIHTYTQSRTLPVSSAALFGRVLRPVSPQVA
jgi:hypothetical protein